MADRNFTPRPAIVRGSLVHQVGEVQFADFKRAACEWSALDAERALDMEDKLKSKHETQDAPTAFEQLEQLKAELTRARASAATSSDAAAHWRSIALAEAEEVGRLRSMLKHAGVRS